MKSGQNNQPTGNSLISQNKQNHDNENLKILKIQRSCVHDGPGIRTTIFFCGCSLRCRWCQNPEALSFDQNPESDINYTASEIIEIVSRDREYYSKTKGGVTLSGGEPLLQDSDSLITLLKLLKNKKIHISVETSLHVPWEKINNVLPYIDLFFIDLKVVGDETRHKELTRNKSALIHENITKLIKTNNNIKFRMVMVPGLNDHKEHIKAAADFLKSINHNSIELMKYHNMYEEKAERLGLDYELLNISQDQSIQSLAHAVKLFKSFDINAESYDLSPSPDRAVFTDRTNRIQNDIRESEYHICFEVSKLKTKYYRKNGFKKPAPIHRAERLSFVLNNKKINIYPEELLAGNFTSKRVGGQVWEEHFGVLFSTILYQINRQNPVSFKCSFKDKLNFYFNIFPFWSKHSVMRKVNPRFSDLVLNIARASDMSTGFNNNMASIAHFVVNFDRMLKLGTAGIKAEIKKARSENPEHDKDFYSGAAICLEALEGFAQRYSDHLTEMSRSEEDPVRKNEFEKMAAICKHVPKNPARTFHEALQSILFLQIALCIESYENAVSFGRLDQILYPYYLEDKNKGLITYDEAKELLALFILKMDEAILVSDGDTYLRIGRLFETQSTDQTVTFGGIDKQGRDASNDVTFMLLDICELQPLAVNMTARIHQKSPQHYLERIAEVYINGAPMPALYNDEIYIETLQKHYPTTVDDARNYSIIGCVEPNASDEHYGNTDCANMNAALPFLQALKGESHELWNINFSTQMKKIINKFIEYNLRRDNKLSKYLLSKYQNRQIKKKIKRDTKHYDPAESMDQLLERFQLLLNRLASAVLADHQKIEKVLRKNFTTPLASSLFKSCIENGKDVYDGGTTFNSSGIQAVGITDVADSLHALNEVVYRKKIYTIDEIIKAIDNNFEGEFYQKIRSDLLAVPKFGNDGSSEAAKWVNKTLDIYVNALNSVKNCPRSGIYAAGYYALNVNIIYGLKTQALPSGRLRGTPLANSVTPHYGMEASDLLSSLNSVAEVDFAEYAPNGTTVTFTIDPSLFAGPDGPGNLAGIISSYFKKGGMQFQPNVLNREILLEAYNDPDKHKYLLVRVAGYCAYFNDLSDELKKAIINRTYYT